MVDNAILGLVQGLTEFLPVSSSGHLFLVSRWIGFDLGLALAVGLHFATLLAVILYLRKECWEILTGMVRLDKTYWGLFFRLLLASFPAALVGFLVKDTVETTFASQTAIGISLLITGGFLFLSDFLKPKGNLSLSLTQITWQQAIVIGLFQSVSVLPGISRSGLTLVGCLLVGLPRELAFRFAFLLSIPVILGSGLLEMGSFSFSPEVLVGCLIAFFIAFFALYLIRKIALMSRLRYFAYYCWILGSLILLALR